MPDGNTLLAIASFVFFVVPLFVIGLALLMSRKVEDEHHPHGDATDTPDTLRNVRRVHRSRGDW